MLTSNLAVKVSKVPPGYSGAVVGVTMKNSMGELAVAPVMAPDVTLTVFEFSRPAVVDGLLSLVAGLSQPVNSIVSLAALVWVASASSHSTDAFALVAATRTFSFSPAALKLQAAGSLPPVDVGLTKISAVPLLPCDSRARDYLPLSNRDVEIVYELVRKRYRRYGEQHPQHHKEERKLAPQLSSHI
jgi:hypothetical protein